MSIKFPSVHLVNTVVPLNTKLISKKILEIPNIIPNICPLLLDCFSEFESEEDDSEFSLIIQKVI